MDTNGPPQLAALLRDGQEALARGAWKEARSAFEDVLGRGDRERTGIFSGLGTAWGEQSARLMLAEAGFSAVEVEQIEGDIFNNYFIATKY